MNRKKPFLKIKTRKTFIPYLLDMDKALLQKQFFEYLMSLAVNGKNNIYIDIKIIELELIAIKMNVRTFQRFLLDIIYVFKRVRN